MLAKNEEMFDIKGDANSGMCLDYQLDAGKIEVPIRYRDRITVADVYVIDEYLSVQLYCPKCENCLTVDSRKKRIRFDRSEKRISIEKMVCTYPACDWRVVVENSVAMAV